MSALIFPSRVVLRLLNTAAMAAAGKYDNTLREPVLEDTDGTGIGRPARTEGPEKTLLAQVATRYFDRLAPESDGAVLEVPNLELTFDRSDLKSAGLIESDGRAKIQPGTRLVRIEDQDGQIVSDFPDPPGMFCVAARPSGFLGARPNLWVCTFADRRQAPGGDLRNAQV